MKDETYTFFEDVREKSKTARSAHARPQRGKSRFKQYTAKEVREMSGPDYSVKLGKRMTFQELKALPESLQQEYIKDILARYKVGATAIAEVLGAQPQACLKHLKALGFTFPRGGRRSEAELERLRSDFGICVAQAPTKKKKQLCKISLFPSAATSTLRALCRSLAPSFPWDRLCACP